MYGIIAYFDNETEEYLKILWKELVDNSISFYSEEVEDRRPHITIADYNCIDEKEFINVLDKFYDSKSEFNITLNCLGTFMNSGALFITPTMSKELLDFHNSHHKHFEPYNDDPKSFYLPGKWIPHCTIANRLSQEKLTEAFNYCSQKLKPINAKISEIGLIKIGHPDLFYKKLKPHQ